MTAIVTVLGSGTCFHEEGADTCRAHPGFFIRWGEGDRHLLLECSAGIAERLKKIGEDPNKVRHLAISHAHPDHCFLPGFLQTCLCHEMRRPGFDWNKQDAFPRLSIYAPKRIIRSIPILNAFHFEGEGARGLPFPVLELCNMTPKFINVIPSVGLGLGDVTLQSEAVSHDSNKADALAFRVSVDGKTIAYSGDCGFDRGKDTSEGLLKMAENAGLFICEASARVGDEQSARNYGHLNPRQAGKIAKDAGAKHLVLTHYSGIDSDEAMVRDCRGSGFEGGIAIAKDGDKYIV